MDKTYSNASNARRAAKAAKLKDFTIYKDGNWHKIRVAEETAAPAPERKAPKAAKAKTAPKAKRISKAPAQKAAARKAPAKVKAVKGETKGAQLIEMVSHGATVSQLMEALGWLPHTTRAALSRLSKVSSVPRSARSPATRSQARSHRHQHQKEAGATRPFCCLRDRPTSFASRLRRG